jgi:hypothetical protein
MLKHNKTGVDACWLHYKTINTCLIQYNKAVNAAHRLSSNFKNLPD